MSLQMVCACLAFPFVLVWAVTCSKLLHDLCWFTLALFAMFAHGFHVMVTSLLHLQPCAETTCGQYVCTCSINFQTLYFNTGTSVHVSRSTAWNTWLLCFDIIKTMNIICISFCCCVWKYFRCELHVWLLESSLFEIAGPMITHQASTHTVIWSLLYRANALTNQPSSILVGRRLSPASSAALQQINRWPCWTIVICWNTI